MCKVMEDMRKEAKLEGKMEERIRVILRMYKNGNSIEMIADCFGISVDEVKELLDTRNV